MNEQPIIDLITKLECDLVVARRILNDMRKLGVAEKPEADVKPAKATRKPAPEKDIKKRLLWAIAQQPDGAEFTLGRILDTLALRGDPMHREIAYQNIHHIVNSGALKRAKKGYGHNPAVYRKGDQFLGGIASVASTVPDMGDITYTPQPMADKVEVKLTVPAPSYSNAMKAFWPSDGYDGLQSHTTPGNNVY